MPTREQLRPNPGSNPGAVPGRAPRIVSLVPSATEILCAIGGRELLVGRSHECDHPSYLDGVPVVTGQTTRGSSPAEIDRQVREQLATGASLYTLDGGLVESLRPDVILTQDLCAVCSIDLAAVQGMVARWERPPRIVSLNPTSIEDVLDDVLKVGRAAGLAAEASRFAVELRGRFFSAQEHVNPYGDGPRVVFLEWTDPLFVGGHWIAQMVERAGAGHPLNQTSAAEGSGAAAGPQQSWRRAGKSITVSSEQVVAVDPQAVVICPCGVGLAQAQHMAEELANQAWFSGLRAARSGRVAVVDGNQMFSRPGPRLADAMAWLVGWLHGLPGLIPEGFPWAERPPAR
ncbi:MAG: ABC transporter substrate-binding protein [Phycisphaeraceae bacterium]|nr:ABC transporter substrate-binding protein [Phycisphaerae bacterium]MBX3393158.1 ABC transporter substrate-binding protein [Phycisphaeraceae bacterium]HRJ49854.1 ABC transporter substrate-binding protein [Phycisphaerales bacterium]